MNPSPLKSPGRERPSELILRHLENSAFSESPESEVRLPTIRELAQELGVGVSTVGTVYRNLAKEGRIRTEIGNGSFLLPSTPKTRRSELRIGIGLTRRSLIDPEGWHSRIYSSITAATFQLDQQTTLTPVDVETPEDELFRQVKDLSALIIMPGYLLQSTLVAAAKKAGVPAVYLNHPFDGATENFVSANFAKAGEILGNAFRTAKRKDIVMLLEDPCHLSISAHYRMNGLLVGLRYGLDPTMQFRIEVANSCNVAGGAKAMRRILDQGGRCPDAIYTSGDFLAIGCIEELEARGISVPEEVSVVGGTGLNLEQSSHSGLTCCRQPFERIGTEILEMARSLVENGGIALPGRVVPMGWLPGATTLPEENEILATYTATL